MNVDQQIQGAATRLSNLLKRNNSDPVAVESILTQIRNAVLPQPTLAESTAHQRVNDALAAQRAVALLRTEAQLHKHAEDRCYAIMQRLQDTEQRVSVAAAEQQQQQQQPPDGIDIESATKQFHTSVIQPVEIEAKKKSILSQHASDAATQKELEFVSLRTKATSSVAKMMKSTEVVFNKKYQIALSHGGMKGADLVYEICCGIEKGKTIRQHVSEGYDRCSPDYLQLLREEARMLLGGGIDGSATSEFKDLVLHIAQEYNGVAVLAPIKGYKRTVEKVQEKYNGDYSRILDLARGMVVFDTLEQLSCALNYIKYRHDEYGQLLVRAKDRLSPAYDASKLTGGYRDILLNLSFSPGHIVELQLHIGSFLDVKNRRGHQVYEEARSIHMFNSAFTERSYNWSFNSSEEDVEELLDSISSGAITALTLDYSEALSRPENQARLAEAMLSEHCRIQDLSLRSCFCGDDFILKCLPLDDEELWSEDNYHGHVCRKLRFGSKIHEGTEGRISEVGVSRLVRYVNGSLRELDYSGCLDHGWYENCGDSIAKAFLDLANEFEIDKVILLPQLQVLNLKSTGLTPDGMKILEKLKDCGHLGQVNILTDDELRTGPPRYIEQTYLGKRLN